jgi:hypothetical protein
MARILITAAALVLMTCDVDAQRGAVRGGAFGGGGYGSVRYGGGVRGDTARGTYSRSNPGVATRANSGSIRQGHSPGAGDDPYSGYPLETRAKPPTPARAPGSSGSGVAAGPITPIDDPTPKIPAIGSRLSEMPEGTEELRVSGSKYHYHLGLFYRPRFSYGSVEYLRVEAPRGAMLDEPPIGSREVTVKSKLYREYAGTWYEPITRRGRENWKVVKPPIKD